MAMIPILNHNVGGCTELLREGNQYSATQTWDREGEERCDMMCSELCSRYKDRLLQRLKVPLTLEKT